MHLGTVLWVHLEMYSHALGDGHHGGAVGDGLSGLAGSMLETVDVGLLGLQRSGRCGLTGS